MNEYIIKKANIKEHYNENKTLKEVFDNLYIRFKNKNIDNGYVLGKDGCKLFWGNDFSDEIIALMPYEDCDFFELKLFELEKQFNISKLLIPLWINPDGIGGGVPNKIGVNLFFHTDESIHKKGRPHIHAKYSGKECRICLESLRFIDPPFKSKSKQKKTLDFISKYQKELTAYWNKIIVKGESKKFNVFLK